MPEAPKDGAEPAIAEASESAAAAVAEIDALLSEAPPLSAEEVRAIVEALIFASPAARSRRGRSARCCAACRRRPGRRPSRSSRPTTPATAAGLQLVEVAAGLPDHHAARVQRLGARAARPQPPTRLSIQALETLAVIAYKQPVTLPEIIDLRGVKSGGVLKTLLEKRLIRIVGRKEVVGRPMLYGTTKEFLLHFGLKDLAELPKIEEFAEVLGEEVDVVGLKRAIEAPRPVEVPLDEAEGLQSQITFEVPIPADDSADEDDSEKA